MGEKEDVERSQTWEGQDDWKAKSSEVGAGNKFKCGGSGGHSGIQSREQSPQGHGVAGRPEERRAFWAGSCMCKGPGA